MRRVVFRVFALSIIACVLAVGLAAVSLAEEADTRILKKRIAVAGFENKVHRWWTWDWEIGTGMEEMLITALVNTGKFTVLERQALDDILAEQKLGETGKVSAQTSAQAGKLLGAQALVRGAITEFAHEESGIGGGISIKGLKIGANKQTAHVGIDLRMYDTITGEITFSENVDGKAETTAVSLGGTYQGVSFGGAGFQKTPLGQATREVIDRAVELIVEQMKDVSWQGAVVLVKGTQVYVNAGDADNVDSGDVFEVFSQGEELIDPMTGICLGSEEQFLGIIRVTSVKDKYSIAEVEKGEGFDRGDIVREAH